MTQIHTQYDFPGGVISLSQTPLPDSTQYPRETDIRDAGGIRISNPRKRAVAETRLRLRGHRHRI